MKTIVPIFDLKSTFDTAIDIGSDRLPIHIKRFSRAELEAFMKNWALFLETRGNEPASDEFKANRLRFYEDTIREAVTLDAGLIRDCGKDVVDGAGLMGVFHSRVDVLSDLVAAVYIENRLGGVIRKNLNSPRASETGSVQSIPARGGERQGSIADAAAPKGSTSLEAAAPSDEPSSETVEQQPGGPHHGEDGPVH